MIYELTHLNFNYASDQPVLKDLSLQIKGGERWAVIGRSGSGKSTLLQLLAGLIQPMEGHVQYQGKDLPGQAKTRTGEKRNAASSTT